MKLFPVYPLMPITPIKAKGSWLFDEKGDKFLDLYGGHAVISIGHSHPHYVNSLKNQLDNFGFYSNSVNNPLQEKFAELLGNASGLPDYQLFLCSSGAEAIENALKIASFKTGKKKILSMKNAFHGRTSGAVAITDNKKIVSPFNEDHAVHFIELNDIAAATKEIESGEYAGVIIEPLQGVGGIIEASIEFLEAVDRLCKANDCIYIIDEVQSGFGRSGKFFAYQYANIRPDVITMAKGMGNGFPVGGILINPKIEATFGMLGTTFGGNHLACAACIAVLETLEKENLIANAKKLESEIKEKLKSIPEIKEIRGKGLMIGFDFDFPIKEIRSNLALEEHILVGSSSNPNTMRLLPALNIKIEEIDLFITAIKNQLSKKYATK